MKNYATLAIDQYQDRVDAIIHLTTGASSDGKAFTVSGQAVEVVGPVPSAVTNNWSFSIGPIRPIAKSGAADT